MSDLIEIETQFRVMNMELESKTKELLQRADDVVQINPIMTLRATRMSYPQKININQNLFQKNQLIVPSPRPMHIEPQINILRYTWQSDDSDNYFNGFTPVKNDNISDLLSIKERIKNDMKTDTPKKEPLNDYKDQNSSSSPFDSMPNLNEIRSKESLDSYSFKSEDDNPIDDMMKTFDDQKDFNKTLDGMLKIKKRNNFSLQENGDMVKSSHGDAAIIKALRKRLSTLEEELQKYQDNFKKKNAEYESLMKSNQNMEDNKVKLNGQINSLKTQLVKMEAKTSSLSSKLQLKETECRALRSEKEALIRTAKEAAQGTSGSEVRLARSKEEIQTLKNTLNTIKAQEKEIRESAKHQVDELKHALGRSEKREREALASVRKQALLIDNLKRQVALLETKHQVSNIDKQLDEVIKWKHKKN